MQYHITTQGNISSSAQDGSVTLRKSQFVDENKLHTPELETYSTLQLWGKEHCPSHLFKLSKIKDKLPIQLDAVRFPREGPEQTLTAKWRQSPIAFRNYCQSQTTASRVIDLRVIALWRNINNQGDVREIWPVIEAWCRLNEI